MKLSSKKLYVYSLITKLLPPTRLYPFKAALLRWCGADVGKNVRIASSAKFLGSFNLSIGDNTFIGHETMLMASDLSTIELGKNVILGSQVTLVTGGHKYTPEGPSIEGPGTYANIKICDGAAVSTRSLVLPGKTVGEMAHVAAGSVVTHDVEPYTRVGGVPARFMKNFKE